MSDIRVSLVVVLIALTIGSIDGRNTPRRKSNTQTNWKSFFCSTWFHWPWLENSNLVSYSRERVSQKRSFVRDCEVDVGTCPVGACFKCPDSGYICPETETRTHTCQEFGTWSYEYVKKCICCKDHGLTVNVKIVDSETKVGIEGINIRFEKNIIGDSDANGRLVSVVPSDSRNIVIRATDLKTDTYIETVKIYDIMEGFFTTVEVEIAMVRKTFSLEFDATKKISICLSENQNCLESKDGTPQIDIAPGSLRNNNRQIYKGLVKISISLIDESNENSEAKIPGRYVSSTSNPVAKIIPLLTFSLDCRSNNNEKLRISKTVNFYSSDSKNARIWNIDLQTGFWREAKTTSVAKRRKRQTADQTQFLTTIVSGQWMTLGQISSLPSCYIKARVFDKSSGTDISNSLTTFYQSEIIATDSNNQKIRYYFAPTQTLEDTCFEVSCPTDSSLSGTIQLKAIANIGTPLTSAITYLSSKPLGDYELSIQSKHTNIEYSSTSYLEEPGTYAKFTSDPGGPFFEDISTCVGSDATKPAFHFIYSDPLTTMSPSTTHAKLCTARIGFEDPEGLFFKYLSSLDTLPTIEAISTWEEGYDRFYFTDFSRMEYSSGGGYYYACVKYRCAPPAEEPYDESIGDTALYLDILLPNKVKIDLNDDGVMVDQSVDCKTGNCHGPFCISQYQYKADKNFIDGSLWVERGNNVPGSFFLPTSDPLATDTCSASSITTDFAYTMKCFFGNPQ